MENPFFVALEGRGIDASTLDNQTNNVLMPFVHYLNNSIKALENKEVSCEWRPVANQRYRLKPNKKIWRLLSFSEIEIVSGQEGWYEILKVDGDAPGSDFDPDEAEPVYQGKGKGRRESLITKNGFRTDQGYYLHLPDIILDDEPVSWCGYQLVIRSLLVALDNLEEVHVDGQECKVRKQTGQRLRLEGHIKENSLLSIGGKSIAFTLHQALDESLLKQYKSRVEGNNWLLFSEVCPSHGDYQLEDTTSKALSELSCAHFQFQGKVLSSDQWSLSVDNDCLILENREDSQFKVSDVISCPNFPELEWSVEPSKVEEKWIQLIEKDNGDDTGKSELDYFFDDNQNIKILDSTQRKNEDGFRILKARQDERQLLLVRSTRGKKNWNSEYPSEQGKSNEIRVSVDTSQLKRQKNAVNLLMSRPSVGHWPLIQLLQDYQSTRWPDVTPVPEEHIKWRVLTDPNFDGCDRQREFVAKALAAEDFSILDGPPGTGKTTTILELIYQLVIRGKRVLLSASTHAAINNVLERVKENSELSQTIFPLRVGDESNAIGVEEFQFDNLFNNLKTDKSCENISKKLMVDASNLVCGTTLGILRLFNDRDVSLDAGEPPFDVMVIDECSKTTFQEFLVPAQFAKRWVLVGDIRQLSPFTDREQIVANLDNLMLVPSKGKGSAQTLSPAIQQACFLLEEFRGQHQNPYCQPILVPVSSSVLQALQKELTFRRKLTTQNKGLGNILLITQTQQGGLSTDWVKDFDTIRRQPWHLYSANLCFSDESVLATLQSLIPGDMLVLHQDWQRTQQAALHRGIGTESKSFKVKSTTFTDTIKIYHELMDRIDNSRWSEEVCWRLEREYWLRLSLNHSQKIGYLKDTLERLFPKSVQADGRIHVLKNIAFPSILEALSGDGLVRRKNDVPTTLNQGFDRSEKRQRYTTLTYQHRMHPDISAFPRGQFYPQGVLSDGGKTTIDRAWTYARYVSRNTWLDVSGTTVRNANVKEVRTVINELKAFCDWAEGKAKNKKNEPFDVAILTFYKGQEKALREALQKELPENNNRYARFKYKGISIKLATVDYFQGQEADVVFLSMVNTNRDGFMDSPNRLNVSITRARYQLVIVGHHEYFSKFSRTDELLMLAQSCQMQSSESIGQRSKYGSNKRKTSA